MTARDEAIDAMCCDAILDRGGEHISDFLAAALDIIPDDVLVRLAIERGALKWVNVGTPDDTGRVFVTDDRDFYQELDDNDEVLWPVTP